MKYRASRFNFRTTSPNNEIIIYNSAAGTLGAVPAEEKEKLKYFLHKKTVLENPTDSLALDLIEGGYLIPEETDETKELLGLIEQRDENSELFITIMPTEDCNFRCVYCFEHFKRGSMSKEIQDGVFNFVRKKLENKDKPYNRLHVNWFGGEPLYALDVLENLGGKFQSLTKELGVDYHSSITTNGYLLNKEVFSKLINLSVRYYTITLDGLKHNHDVTRVHREGFGTFDTIIENMKEMRGTSYEFTVQMRSNYSPKSYENLDEFLNFIKREFGKDKRFDNIDVRPIFDQGGFNEGNFDECVSAHLRNKFKGLNKARDYGLFNRSLKMYIQPGGIICNASKPNYWLFGSDGKIMRCNVELDTHDRNVVGRITNEGSAEIDYDKLSMWLDVGKNDKNCHKCYFAPSCQGAYCGKLRFENEEKNIKEQPCPTEKKQLSELLRVVYEEMMVL